MKKWILVVGLVFLGVLAFAACGDGNGDGDATPTATVAPAATPTPPADGEVAGAEGFREFIPTFQEALDDGDASFLRDRALTEAYVCTPEAMALTGPGGPACDFEGQVFDGFIEGYWRSEGGIIDVEDAFSAYDAILATALPVEIDDFGDGSVQVYALNIEEDGFDAIITAIIERPSDFITEFPLRVSYGTAWAFEDGRWMVTSTLTANVLGEELLEPPSGDTANLYPNWERYEG